MMALPFPDARVRPRDDRLRHSQRAGHRAGDRRDSAASFAPGGRLLSLDFNRPADPLVRAVYLGYLTVVGSALGLGPAPATRTPIATSRSRSAAIRAPRASQPRCSATAASARAEALPPVLGGLMAHPPGGQIARRFAHSANRRQIAKNPWHSDDDSVTIDGSEIPDAFVGRQPPRHRCNRLVDRKPERNGS